MSEKQTKKEAAEVLERPYTLRKLKDGDLIPLLSLLRKLGLKDFKSSFSKMASGESAEQIGLTVFLDMGDTIISHLEGEAGEEVYRFWASLCGLSADEIKDMEFGTLPMMIYDTLGDVKNCSFFKVLSKLL